MLGWGAGAWWGMEGGLIWRQLSKCLSRLWNAVLRSLVLYEFMAFDNVRASMLMSLKLKAPLS